MPFVVVEQVGGHNLTHLSQTPIASRLSENPLALSNTVEIFPALVAGAVLTNTVGNQKQDWALLAAMIILFLAITSLIYVSEAQGVPAIPLSDVVKPNNEPKELRSGSPGSSPFAGLRRRYPLSQFDPCFGHDDRSSRRHSAGRCNRCWARSQTANAFLHWDHTHGLCAVRQLADLRDPNCRQAIPFPGPDLGVDP